MDAHGNIFEHNSYKVCSDKVAVDTQAGRQHGGVSLQSFNQRPLFKVVAGFCDKLYQRTAPYFLELPASTMLHIDGRHVYCRHLFALGGSRSGALAARTMDAVSQSCCDIPHVDDRQ